MKRSGIAALIFVLGLTAACRDEPSKNVAGLSEKTYQASGANQLPMTFPGGAETVFKPFGKYKDKERPQVYSQPNTWVVYMAAPGWTNGGMPIVDRLATDAVAVERVKQFIFTNNLQSQVRVAWLQYDQNPSGRYMESLDTVPDNFIPLFLKGFGPQVDYYIHSPAHHAGQAGGGCVMTSG